MTGDLIRLALRVVDDAVSRADAGGLERTWGHRLALHVLLGAGIAEPWQARDFWEHLAPEHDRHEYEHNVGYVQYTGLATHAQNWRQKFGLPAVDPLGHRNARRYWDELDFGSGTQQRPCMCNRYMPGDRQNISDHFSARLLRETNEGPPIVHPKQPGWVVRLVDSQPVLEQMTWGFPTYIRGKAGKDMILRPVNNARMDKLQQHWKKWAMVPEQRCLIPTRAWAEAVGKPGAMSTTWLSLPDSPIFAWAGLWRDSDEWGPSYTGMMTDAPKELKVVHDRMPVILDREDWETWLAAPIEELVRFDRPYPADRIRHYDAHIPWKDGGSTLPPPETFKA